MNENNHFSSQRKRSTTLFTDVDPISDSTKSIRPEQHQSISDSNLSDIPNTDFSNQIEQLMNQSTYYVPNEPNFASDSIQIPHLDFTVDTGQKNTLASQQSTQLHPPSMQPIQGPYLSQQEADQENRENFVESRTARPYQNDSAPFPLPLDRRHFKEQASHTSARQKGKKRVNSEDIRCCECI